MIEDEYGTSITDENTLDYLLHMDFTLIEENQDIDIQSIEEINLSDNIDIVDKVNELTKAIKQLDRQINNN